jgi:bacteriocin biosynthesis cyclodehydratase domain-containing protein
MLNKPQFRPHFHVQVVPPDHVFLVSETKTHVLEGAIYQHLAPLLTGEHGLEGLMTELADKVTSPEMFFALHRLEGRGYIVEADARVPPPSAAFWSAMALAPSAAAARVAAATVSIRVAGAIDAGPLIAALSAVGIRVDDAGEAAVVLTDDYARGDLAEINAEALASGRPWLLAKPVGAVMWTGPMFVPGRTACWACLHDRLRRNRHVDSFVQARTGRETSLGRSLAALPGSLQTGMGLAATEIARWIAQGSTSPLEGHINTLDLVTLESRTHAVTRRPQCPVCGDPAAYSGPPGPLTLASCPKRFTADGGHRAFTPEETYDRVKSLVSPITGVVTSLLRKEPVDNGLTFSYASGHDFSVVSDDIKALQANMRYRSGGKGMNDVQARVSGICEAVERYSGVHRGDEYTLLASERELGDSAVHLNDILLFSDRQFEQRQAWNRTCSDSYYHVVPEPLDPDREIAWVPYWSLTNQCARHVPAALTYYGHPDGGRGFAFSDANGTAAGNTREEAILQGLLELVERDSVALWWYNRVPRPAVDLESFDLPYCRTLSRYYASLNRDLWVLDLTSDLGIPTYAAVSRRTDRPAEDIIVSFGAHLDPMVALTRALTESNQFLPALSRTTPDGATRYLHPDAEAIAWWKEATIANQPYLVPDASARAVQRADHATPRSEDLRDDVQWIVDRLEGHGLEVLALDQTRPDVGLPVVKMIVPGLRHFWRRLGPGRLYDVPVKLGWLDRPCDETALNPYSMFF